METRTNLLEPLLEKAEAYSKTSFEVMKLKAVDKTADILSTLASRGLLTVIVCFFAFTLNIAVGLWLGELLGRAYYGFLIITCCYALAGVVLLLIHPFIKGRVNNAVIRRLFN
ncbi:MAG TPA: hypothetical protein PKC54_06545 [Ferruginibacter sp.]|nr:hypothetical protein [Ferruginibacter sp.]